MSIAIDDVGAGHGGLSYILKLGADIIKIDKMFVDALGSDNHSSTIIETLVDLAESMRMDIIAEGVETFEQVVALREHGIRTAQGYRVRAAAAGLLVPEAGRGDRAIPRTPYRVAARGLRFAPWLARILRRPPDGV